MAQGKITEQELDDPIVTKINNVFVELKGSSNFNGGLGTVINHSIGHTNYYVVVLPTQDSAGYLGEIWVEYSANSFKVCNSGSATTGFKYLVIR